MDGNKSIKNRWLHVRFDELEHKRLMDQFSRTTETHLSKYARKILLGKPMIARVRDESLKDIVAILGKLQKDLNGIANNYNQMVHKLHISDSSREVNAWILTYEREKECLFESIRTIREFISETSVKWLR